MKEFQEALAMIAKLTGASHVEVLEISTPRGKGEDKLVETLTARRDMMQKRADWVNEQVVILNSMIANAQGPRTIASFLRQVEALDKLEEIQDRIPD